MKWEKALKYTRKHKRMIAVMMAGVIGFACFYSADASVIKDAKKKKNEAQQNLDNINQQINNIQSEQSKVKSQMAAYDGIAFIDDRRQYSNSGSNGCDNTCKLGGNDGGERQYV